MKRIFVALAVIFLTLTLSAQTIADEYMKRIPPLPVDSCYVSRAFADSFRESIVSLSEEIRTEITNLNNEAERYMLDNEELAQENALNQMSQSYGISNDDLELLKNADNMSEEEAMAFAGRVIKQRTNLSMGEIEKLSGMSEAAQEIYIEAYSSEFMTAARNGAGLHEQNESTERSYLLAGEQQSQLGSLTNFNQQVELFYAGLENDPGHNQTLDSLQVWQSLITSMTGISYGQGREIDSLSLLIQSKQMEYCNIFTPRYRKALRQHLHLLQSKLQELINLDRTTAGVTLNQTGIRIPEDLIGLSGLEAIDTYLNKLKEAYGYTLFFQETD
jgi:hypothetical protein